ncbi:regulatory protein RecX [Pseudorhizobium halotolerans]|uniref:Regulatory protein RecX n=1 Tax=Pseudorhizobium halotolerans TaxID=1233081 RepID=A0ABN7JJL5_9HYPH|nr:regulatory protein RecX [Pseudorhizobium halotolerans]
MSEKVTTPSNPEKRPSLEDSETDADVPTARMLAWARNSALYRLSRRMMTEQELGSAVRRKAKQKFEGITELQLQALAARAIDCGRQVGGLDDQAYSASRVRAGVRGGKSRRQIADTLRRKGVSNDTVTEVLLDADDLRAATAYARKRGFGPFRTAPADEKRLARELASLARRGFSLDIVRRITSMEREEAEEVMADSHW